jgi:hypothetical protein
MRNNATLAGTAQPWLAYDPQAENKTLLPRMDIVTSTLSELDRKGICILNDITEQLNLLLMEQMELRTSCYVIHSNTFSWLLKSH